MSDAKRDPILDYRGIPVRPVKPWDDAEYRRWRRWRVWFRMGVILALSPITLYFGPNLIIFGRLIPPTPVDFVSAVERSAVPTVRAMKQYERDHGHLPDHMEDLIPTYLASAPDGQSIVRGYFCQFTFRGAMHRIEYDFLAGSERWTIHGPFIKGIIPVPPVTIGPATRPTTMATK